MTDENDAWKPKRFLKRHTYYKVQVFDDVSLTWRDEKEGFDEKDEANNYRRSKFSTKRTRLMVVEGRKRFPIDEE